MLKKITFALGLSAGYVLGARAGRKRYEQIAASAKRLWKSEPVQNRVDDAGDAVKRYAPQAASVAFDGVKQVSKLVTYATKSGSNDAKHGADAPSGTASNPAH